MRIASNYISTLTEDGRSLTRLVNIDRRYYEMQRQMLITLYRCGVQFAFRYFDPRHTRKH